MSTIYLLALINEFVPTIKYILWFFGLIINWLLMAISKYFNIFWKGNNSNFILLFFSLHSIDLVFYSFFQIEQSIIISHAPTNIKAEYNHGILLDSSFLFFSLIYNITGISYILFLGFVINNVKFTTKITEPKFRIFFILQLLFLNIS